MSKDRMFSVRMPIKLVEDFKKMCEDNSWVMAKRFRKLVEADIIRYNKYKAELEKKNEGSN